MKELLGKITGIFTNHAEWWNDYLTEMSVLVISLGATYYGDSLVNGYMEKQEDMEAMKMIRSELVDNLKELKEMEVYYLQEIRLSETLGSVLFYGKRIEEDSLDTYCNLHRFYYYISLKTSAFDMVRESGTIQRIDKEILTHLFGCYERLAVVQDMSERYREERITRLLAFTARLSGGKHAATTAGQWKQIKRDRMFRQYLLTSLPLMAKSALVINNATQQLVREMIVAVDEAYPP